MTNLLFYALIVLFIGSVAVGMIAGFLVLLNRKTFDGSWKFWFDMTVWFSPSRAEKYLTVRGMRFLRISIGSAFVSSGLVFAVILLFFMTGGPT